MRIVSCNIHKGRDRRGRDVFAQLADAFAALAPDVLACQEVYHGREDEVVQSEHLAESLQSAHVFGGNAFYTRGCHGNATFSKLPVHDHRNHDVSLNLLERRGILETILEPDDGARIVTMNTHFSLTGRQRRRQWAALTGHLAQHEVDAPTIVCGDFNDWRGVLDRRVQRTGQFVNALWSLPRQLRRTYPSHRPRLALDRVYLRGLRVEHVAVLRGEPWSSLSDHLPIVVDLRPRRPGPAQGSG